MTKAERNEIAITINAVLTDDCNEIRNKYIEVNGNLKGLRKFVHDECIAFWTEADPYLNEEQLDYEWISVGDKIINFDDCWMWILGALVKQQI